MTCYLAFSYSARERNDNPCKNDHVLSRMIVHCLCHAHVHGVTRQTLRDRRPGCVGVSGVAALRIVGGGVAKGMGSVIVPLLIPVKSISVVPVRCCSRKFVPI